MTITRNAEGDDLNVTYTFRLTAFSRFCLKNDLSVLLLGRENLGVELEFQALLLKQSLELFSK